MRAAGDGKIDTGNSLKQRTGLTDANQDYRKRPVWPGCGYWILSMIVAGGTASSLMADFGAEVVKIERPGGGDPLRNWGPFANGVSLWWKVHSRNKKSVTLNLGTPEGQSILKDMAAKADALIEGFRPGVMERWGLGPDDLLQVNPGLIMLRYSGFGQTGPYKDRPGFGHDRRVHERLRGHDRFPGHPAGAAPGAAGRRGGRRLRSNGRNDGPVPPRRRRQREGPGGRRVFVRAALPAVHPSRHHVRPDGHKSRARRQRFPRRPPPRSLYRTSDQRWMGLSATSQSTFEGLARAMGMPELIDRPSFLDNASRIENRDELNDELNSWLSQRTLNETLDQLIPAGGVVGPVYGAADIVEDPHYQAREDIIEINDPELGHTRMLGIVPKFSETPGAVEHAGPTVGQHNSDIYGEWLGLSAAELAGMTERGVI